MDLELLDVLNLVPTSVHSCIHDWIGGYELGTRVPTFIGKPNGTPDTGMMGLRGTPTKFSILNLVVVLEY